MRKLNEPEMKKLNGGYWVYGFTDPKDEYLPIGNYKPGDVHERNGSYTVAFGGKVAYIVYWRPSPFGGDGYRFRTA